MTTYAMQPSRLVPTRKYSNQMPGAISCAPLQLLWATVITPIRIPKLCRFLHLDTYIIKLHILSSCEAGRCRTRPTQEPPPEPESYSIYLMETNVSKLPTAPVRKSSSDHLNRQLGLYSLAAAVAGVSVLALAQPAESEVVVTKKNVPIVNLGIRSIPISLTNNGINDFSFSLYSFSGYSHRESLRMWPLEGGAVVAQASSRHILSSALPLVRGAKIGPSAQFSNVNFANIEESQEGRQFSGLWGVTSKNRFLGVKFLISGETHYGWIRLTVNTDKNGFLAATITGYAYETIANKKIQAGVSGNTASSETPTANQAPAPSLGMLALGADALPVWRRETSRGK